MIIVPTYPDVGSDLRFYVGLPLHIPFKAGYRMFRTFQKPRYKKTRVGLALRYQQYRRDYRFEKIQNMFLRFTFFAICNS